MRVRRATAQLALSLGAVLAGGCVSAADCSGDVPEALRADTLRYVLDREMLRGHSMRRDDLSLALGAGTPAGALTEKRIDEIAPYAVGYASCVRSRAKQK